jgi:hypothetical protein
LKKWLTGLCERLTGESQGMKLLPPRDTLEIEVADFGPIVEAKVDLAR